jgi:hypothetical protein
MKTERLTMKTLKQELDDKIKESLESEKRFIEEIKKCEHENQKKNLYVCMEHNNSFRDGLLFAKALISQKVG